MQTQPSEQVAVVAKVNPANNNNSAANSDAVDMSKFREAMFILVLGAVDSTNDFKLQESVNGSSGWQDLSGKSITQLGGTDDGKVAIINLKAEELSAGYRYARAVNTVGNGTTNLTCVVGLGLKPCYGPASDDDLAAVAQIVT
jgi:hypothetical protein